MLEQKHDSITSRRYIRNAENQIEIHDYEYSNNGDVKYKISEYNNYDPKVHGMSLQRKLAGRHGLTVSFLGTDEVSTTPGKPATPIYTDGELQYVLTADFELEIFQIFGIKSVLELWKRATFHYRTRSDDTMCCCISQAEFLQSYKTGRAE